MGKVDSGRNLMGKWQQINEVCVGCCELSHFKQQSVSHTVTPLFQEVACIVFFSVLCDF